MLVSGVTLEPGTHVRFKLTLDSATDPVAGTGLTAYLGRSRD